MTLESVGCRAASLIRGPAQAYGQSHNLDACTPLLQHHVTYKPSKLVQPKAFSIGRDAEILDCLLSNDLVVSASQVALCTDSATTDQAALQYTPTCGAATTCTPDLSEQITQSIDANLANRCGKSRPCNTPFAHTSATAKNVYSSDFSNQLKTQQALWPTTSSSQQSGLDAATASVIGMNSQLSGTISKASHGLSEHDFIPFILLCTFIYIACHQTIATAGNLNFGSSSGCTPVPSHALPASRHHNTLHSEPASLPGADIRSSAGLAQSWKARSSTYTELRCSTSIVTMYQVQCYLILLPWAVAFSVDMHISKCCGCDYSRATNGHTLVTSSPCTVQQPRAAALQARWAIPKPSASSTVPTQASIDFALLQSGSPEPHSSKHMCISAVSNSNGKEQESMSACHQASAFTAHASHVQPHQSQPQSKKRRLLASTVTASQCLPHDSQACCVGPHSQQKPEFATTPAAIVDQYLPAGPDTCLQSKVGEQASKQAAAPAVPIVRSKASSADKAAVRGIKTPRLKKKLVQCIIPPAAPTKAVPADIHECVKQGSHGQPNVTKECGPVPLKGASLDDNLPPRHSKKKTAKAVSQLSPLLHLASAWTS